jgi:hypothetical protein
LRDRGLVTIDEQPNGPLTMWSSKLTPEGEAVVAAYCTERGIENPVVAARERQVKAAADLDEALQEAAMGSAEGARRLRARGARMTAEAFLQARQALRPWAGVGNYF